MESQRERDKKSHNRSVFSPKQLFVGSVTGWPSAKVHLPWEMVPQKNYMATDVPCLWLDLPEGEGRASCPLILWTDI